MDEEALVPPPTAQWFYNPDYFSFVFKFKPTFHIFYCDA